MFHKLTTRDYWGSAMRSEKCYDHTWEKGGKGWVLKMGATVGSRSNASVGGLWDEILRKLLNHLLKLKIQI